MTNEHMTAAIGPIACRPTAQAGSLQQRCFLGPMESALLGPSEARFPKLRARTSERASICARTATITMTQSLWFQQKGLHLL